METELPIEHVDKLVNMVLSKRKDIAYTRKLIDNPEKSSIVCT